jgi:hypothetical protein
MVDAGSLPLSLPGIGNNLTSGDGGHETLVGGSGKSMLPGCSEFQTDPKPSMYRFDAACHEI